MNIYIVHLEQGGEGCDYTIGCGEKTIVIEAENISDAESKLTELVKQEYSGEMSLDSVTIYEVSSYRDFNIESVYGKMQKEEQEQEESEIKEKELRELNRLKEKYSKK